MKGVEKIRARGKPSTELSRDFLRKRGPLLLQTVRSIALLCEGKESPPTPHCGGIEQLSVKGRSPPPLLLSADYISP